MKDPNAVKSQAHPVTQAHDISSRSRGRENLLCNRQKPQIVAVGDASQIDCRVPWLIERSELVMITKDRKRVSGWGRAWLATTVWEMRIW